MLSPIKQNYSTFSISYLILILCLVSVRCIRNHNTGIGIVQNVSVSVFQDHALNNNSGELKLNISWLPPLNGKSPSSYSILIASNSNEEIKKTSCPNESLYHTTENGKTFQVLLPERKFLSELSELNVRLKCSYKIQIFANPRTNLSHTLSTIYTVPECVGLMCSCKESHKFLPVPKIHTKFLSNGDIAIEWKSNSKDSRICAYSISLGLPLLVSKNGLPVYEKVKLIELSGLNSSFVWKKAENVNYQNSMKKLSIFVAAVDIQGCQGNDGSSRIDFPKSQKNITQVLIGMIAICILFISTILCLRSRKTNNAILFDRNLPRSRRIDLVLRNRNILYVEPEIEEINEKTNHKEYEVDYNDINIKKEIGKGQFGNVYLASLQGRDIPVAVKISVSNPIHNVEARKHLLGEIEVIKAAGPHPHLVDLVGYCISTKNPICLLLEYMEGGDLLCYLHSLRDTTNNFQIKYSDLFNKRSSNITEMTFNFGNQSLPLLDNGNSWNEINSIINYVNIPILEMIKDEIIHDTNVIQRSQFLSFALQIASGMEHLESKKIIHRDLAARNILLDSNFNLKISDFGLSRCGLYTMGNGAGVVRRLPIRWMSPEALRERAFTSKSDVWSFAVVLWEIGTLGMFPYSNVQDDDLLKYILCDKGRLPKPDNVEYDIFDIMKICWSSKSEQRPSFAELVSWFNLLAESDYFSDKNIGKSNLCYSLFQLK